MSSEDDDLPVLTQVLRTGSGHVPPFVHVEARSGDVAFADPEGQRALVIGSDPEPSDEELPLEPNDRWSAHALTALLADDTDPSSARSGDGFASTPTVADPRRIDLRHNDVFLRSAPTDAAFADRIDEPPLDVHAIDHSTPAMTTSRDVPLVFSDPYAPPWHDPDATLALRVRNSVLQELSGRIDTELDARIAQTLHAGLETALAQLQTSLRIELGEALRDVVGNAVDEAIRRLGDPSRANDLV